MTYLYLIGFLIYTCLVYTTYRMYMANWIEVQHKTDKISRYTYLDLATGEIINGRKKFSLYKFTSFICIYIICVVAIIPITIGYFGTRNLRKNMSTLVNNEYNYVAN